MATALLVILVIQFGLVVYFLHELLDTDTFFKTWFVVDVERLPDTAL